MLWTAFCLAAIQLLGADALLNGVPEHWDRHAYLVKVFARSSPSNDDTVDAASGSSGIRCTGTLVSPRLVLTLPACLMSKGRRFSNIMVVLPRLNRARPAKLSADIVQWTNDWVLLRIAPQDPVELCPPGTARNRMARLPLRPSLTASAILTLDERAVTQANCTLYGFKTTESNDGMFGQTRNMLSIRAYPMHVDSYGRYTAPVFNNRTACFDDPGAPLICDMSDYEMGNELQVGLLAGVQLPDTNAASVSCLDATALSFNPLRDLDRLAKTIETYDLVGYVHAYSRCFPLDGDIIAKQLHSHHL